MTKQSLILSTALIFSATTASAHHGTSAHFDHDKEINVEGVVTEMKFVNPHSYLYFDVIDDSGEVVPWRCEMVEAGTLRRAGLTSEILAPGTVVRVNGQPARRENAVCYLETMTLTDGTTISHRGQIGRGGASFTPSAATLGIDAGSSIDNSIVLAQGGSEAANRKIVPVPSEGLFGYWADGTRSSLNANARNAAELQAQAMGARETGNAIAEATTGGMGAGGMGDGGGMGTGGDATSARGGGMGTGGGGMGTCLLYTSPSPRDRQKSRMPSSA